MGSINKKNTYIKIEENTIGMNRTKLDKFTNVSFFIYFCKYTNTYQHNFSSLQYLTNISHLSPLLP